MADNDIYFVRLDDDDNPVALYRVLDSVPAYFDKKAKRWVAEPRVEGYRLFDVDTADMEAKDAIALAKKWGATADEAASRPEKA